MSIHHVEALHPNGYNKSELRSNFAELYHDCVYSLIGKDLPFEVVYKIGNYTVREHDDYYFVFDSSPIPIGLIGIDNRNGLNVSTISFLVQEHQGKGLLTRLYHALIRDGLLNSSDDSVSPGAVKVWKFLCEKFQTGYIYWPRQKWWAPIVDWGPTKGYPVYPMIQTPDGEVLTVDVIEKKVRFNSVIYISPDRKPPKGRMIGIRPAKT